MKFKPPFLTATFELRPSKRKASVLDYVRSEAEETFWKIMEQMKPKALEAVSCDKDAREVLFKNIHKQALISSKNLSESVATALAADVLGSVKSFVELSLDDSQNPSYPEKKKHKDEDYIENLLAFSTTTDIEQESILRAKLVSSQNDIPSRPFSLVRERDCTIIKDSKGNLSVVLNILKATDSRAKQSIVHEGLNATTNEPIKNSKSKCKIIVPLSCSKWHENKFLHGKASLKSCRISVKNGRCFMHASFQFDKIEEMKLSGNVVGIDRGVVYPVAVTAMDSKGAVISTLGAKGKEIGEIIKSSMRKRAWQQKRRGRSSAKFAKRIDDSLHVLANEIVDFAAKHKAEVVIENLSNLKKVITTKKKKYAKKNTYQKILKNVQLGKLEIILNYKLAQKGMRKIKEVLAAGTSQTCVACGAKHKENRLTRDVFRCIMCSYEQHADISASVVIGRRGLFVVKKGDKLDNLHKNMVLSLNEMGDTGLGPLANLIG